MEIKFAKLYDNVKIPTKRKEDAGYDVYAHFDEDYIVIKPNETIKVTTGLISAFPSSLVCFFKERGSTGTLGIGQRSGVVDSGFRGEWLVPITNHTNKNIFIDKKTEKVTECFDDIFYPYNKAICQAVFLNLPDTEVYEHTIDEVKSVKSERGNGMLGSSRK